MEYPIIRNKPVAQFWYKGTHSHPVKRTVLITEQTKDYFKGYEVREGTQLRDVEKAPIKSFSFEKVATTEQLRSDNPLRKGKNRTTLTRMSVSQAEKAGL
jgi:hypothetical protein